MDQSQKDLTNLNKFCMLFSQLEICTKKPNGKESEEALKLLNEMYDIYKLLPPSMIAYINKFMNKLLICGWDLYALKPKVKVDVSNIKPEEWSISGKFEHTKKLHENQNGAIFNYNEFSKPFGELSSQDFEALRLRTIQNIKHEQYCMERGIRPKRTSDRIPQQWSIPDSQRDW